VYKKLGAICDHTMGTMHFAVLIHNLADKAATFLPSGMSLFPSASFYFF
jgi:hypothetical protein